MADDEAAGAAWESEPDVPEGGILVIHTDLAGLEAEPPGQASWLDQFYRIGFWILLLIILVMACCWYWNVRTLNRLIASLGERAM